MRDKKINTNKIVINKFLYLFVFFLFFVFILTVLYRCLVDYKANGNVTIREFIKNRNIVEETILPSRGNIFDTKGNVLAQDVSSYTLIAYLDSSRTVSEDNPKHVVDKEKTALELSKKISTSYDRILEILNKEAYQVEFGTGGKNLTQLEMEAIRDLKLPGIDFLVNTKRYYPNGDFASYLLGYTKNKELDDGNTWMVGELGIEGYYNDSLTGTKGYSTYEQDGRGKIIANSNEYKEDAIDGDNVYLTIDSSIQLFVENAVKKAQSDSEAEWVLMGIMNAKTGEILGYSSTPSFDPNIRNLTNYMDPLVSYKYEPGSTMKIFSYLCAVDSGKYNGSDTFMSGSKTYVSQIDENDVVTIKDWNVKGWGRISYDYGFAMSSNIGVASLLDDVITKKELRNCYQKYGYGAKTGITLANELSGNISFTYDVEAATAGYGQGIMITPIQMLEALSILANDGEMVSPYVVSKIVSSGGDIILENSTKKIGKVSTKESTKKVRDLMRSVVCNDSSMCTGSAYYMDGYDLIGKTGTASIYENGKYTDWGSNYIYSFAGLYPGDKPEIVLYMAIKKPKDTINYIAPAIKEVTINVSKYLNLDSSNNSVSEFVMDDYSNKVVTSVSKELKDNNLKVITLGTGNKVVSQYPLKGDTLYKNNLVVLLTNNYDKSMIDFSGMSYKEAKIILDIMKVDYDLKGSGYVISQNIESGSIIDKKVELVLEKRW